VVTLEGTAPASPLVITRFADGYLFLSNFFPSPVAYPDSGPEAVIYPTLEHAFQAAKTDDLATRARIRTASSPGRAKRIGQSVSLRPDWERDRPAVMRALLWAKFSAEPLRTRLLATGEARLVEGNTWHDQTWGQCQCVAHVGQPGRNLLGRLLMEVRQALAMSDRPVGESDTVLAASGVARS
jgi:ribA/ribD-fused uncharacterized protein